jgi:FlaG/FlaF family flagellin (archaellin)
VLTIDNGIFTNNTSSDFKGNATIINQSGIMTINGGQIINQSDVYQTRAILNKNTAKLFINQASQEIQTVVKAHTAVENSGTVGDEIEKAVTITGGWLTESVTDDDSMALITTQGTTLVQGGTFEAATGIVTDQSGKIVKTAER